VKYALQKTHNDCHQQLSDSSKLDQICIRSGLCVGPRCGSLQRSPRSPSWLKGPYFYGNEGREGSGGKGDEDTPMSRPIFLNVPTPLRICPSEDGHPSQYQPTDSSSGRGSNLWSLSRKSDALTTRLLNQQLIDGREGERVSAIACSVWSNAINLKS